MGKRNKDNRARRRQPDAGANGDVVLSRGRKAAFAVVTALILLLLAEALSAVALRIVEGTWPYARPENLNYQLFEPHPEWVAAPRKDVTVTVAGQRHHHNSGGFRGDEFPSVKAKSRVACIGGSTTYGVGVGDDQTWVFQLGQLLGPGYEVLNFGIPGHSSVEHRKMLPQILDRYSPDVVVFQMGLNDVRNMNVSDLGADYQNFHQPSLYGAMGFRRRERLPRSALLQASVALLERLKVLPVYPFPDGIPAGNLSDSADPEVVRTFSTNLDVLLRECRAKQIRVVLLPHALSRRTISETNYKWWAPYLTKKGIFNGMDALNATMRERADGDWVVYAGFLDGAVWRRAEFCDPTHLNANGSLRFARLVQQGVPWSRLAGEEGVGRK